MSFAEDLAALTVEFLDALSVIDPVAVRRWRGRSAEVLGLILDRDPDDAKWALEGVDPVERIEDVFTDDDEAFEPSEEDRVFAIAEFERLALERDDYTVPADEVPYEVCYDFLFRDEPELGPNDYDLDDRQFGITEERLPPSEVVEAPPHGKSQKHMF